MSDAMLSKIRKLLAKAEDPACTPAEAEAFNAKATELIARYGVDRALLAARDPGTDPVGDRIVDIPAPYALDKVGLLAGVADALRCRSVRRRGDSGFVMHLFGFASDLERVEVLFTSLLVQAAHGISVAPVPLATIRPRSAGPGWPASPRRSPGGCAGPRRPPPPQPRPVPPRWPWSSPTGRTGSTGASPRPTHDCVRPHRAGC
ncbi:DUF2786 domain-containing protein [Plantactinospora veratri]